MHRETLPNPIRAVFRNGLPKSEQLSTYRTVVDCYNMHSSSREQSAGTLSSFACSAGPPRPSGAPRRVLRSPASGAEEARHRYRCLFYGERANSTEICAERYARGSCPAGFVHLAWRLCCGMLRRHPLPRMSGNVPPCHARTGCRPRARGVQHRVFSDSFYVYPQRRAFVVPSKPQQGLVNPTP